MNTPSPNSSLPLESGHDPLAVRLLHNLLATLAGMVYRCKPDQDWTMEYVSDGCLGLTGYSRDDLLAGGRITFEEVIHVDDRTRVREQIFAAIGARQSYDAEYRIVRADGVVRWVWERGVCVFDADGKPESMEGFIQDVTPRVEAETRLRKAERKFRSIFENTVEGIFQSTLDRGYLEVNPALARIYGYASPAQLIASLQDIDNQLYVDPARRRDFVHLLEIQGVVTGFESRVYRRDGSIIWISENARVVRDGRGRTLFYEGTVEDITERKRHEEEIRYRATHDPLTGLLNRSVLHERIRQSIGEVASRGGFSAVAFIDLDEFKLINDTLGHQVGDELLKTVANRLRACLRESDTITRHGGDEFVLLLAAQPCLDAISHTARRVLEAVCEPWSHNGAEFQVTCSMGIALCPLDGEDVEQLLSHADSAMYRAKELGRNNFQYFSAEMNASVGERLQMLTSLRRALSAGEFELHYQPKFDVSGTTMVGTEALLRWRHPERGLLGPGHFIALAEDTGVISAIGEWVLLEACRQNQAWCEAGWCLPVSVNLSARQFDHGPVDELVSRVLQQTGLPASLLELEITESAMMRDVNRTMALLDQLKLLGVKIAIDDFGTGHCSLGYLKRFPVDTLKIDSSFVKDVVTDEDDATIVKAIISLGQKLKLRVVAEGVENAGQLAFLQANGCDEIQGFLLGRPVPPQQFSRPDPASGLLRGGPGTA